MNECINHRWVEYKDYYQCDVCGKVKLGTEFKKKLKDRYERLYM